MVYLYINTVLCKDTFIIDNGVFFTTKSRCKNWTLNKNIINIKIYKLNTLLKTDSIKIITKLFCKFNLISLYLIYNHCFM